MRQYYFLIFLIITCTNAHAQTTPEISYERYSKSLPCIFRVGRCFDATIAGMKVTGISTQERQEQMTRVAKAKNANARLFYWEVSEEVDGDKVLDIKTMSNAYGLADMGEELEPADIMITPLQKQALVTRSAPRGAKGVKIDTDPGMVRLDILEQDHLPAGEYVITIRYVGKKFLQDTKRVYVKVKSAAAKELK